jgi:asparagine synthase (glutamine-hydrolysing)
VPALLGIVGEGSLDELRRMADRMAYRGGRLQIARPAPNLLFGKLHSEADELDSDDALCLDADAPLYPRGPRDMRSFDEVCTADRVRLAADLRRRGVTALAEVTGTFALAHWDEASDTVLLATDPLGYKTFYYVVLPGRVAFASDYKALLALEDCPTELDRDALQTYLVHFRAPPGRSFLLGIRPLSQAARLRIRNGEVTRGEVPPPKLERSRGSFAANARQLRSRLGFAVASQLAGVDRAAILLSGGFDSTALLALVRHVRPDIQLTSYTIGDGLDDPDIVGARDAAAHFGCEHQEVVYDLGRLATDLPRVVWQTEDPSGREESVLQSAITGIAAARQRVVLSGYGADALFAGMPRHRILWMRDFALPPLRGALCELFQYTQYRRNPSSWLGRRLVARAYRGDIVQPPEIQGARTIGGEDGCVSLARYRQANVAPTSGFQHDEPVLAGQGAALAMPFLEPSVVQLALASPDRHLIGPRGQKLLLRAAVADLLPGPMRGIRKTIQRFRHDRGLADAFKPLLQDLDLARSLADRGLVAAEDVASLCAAHGADGALSSERVHALWSLACAELWMRMFIDHRGQGLPAPLRRAV